MRPEPLPPNVIDHFYEGGRLLAALRGVEHPSPRRPEEWLAATVARADDPAVGPSRLTDGRLLADHVSADRLGWTGAAEPATGAGPADTGVLVKLLDAGQRLPVHVHPTRDFARAHLHSCYGKTEAWYVLAAGGDDPAVWVGWREDVDPTELAVRVDAQDSGWLLSRLNKISVRPGDGILVPAGEPHATGSGVFVVEAQEPTDLSILLEWSVTRASREESHLDPGSTYPCEASTVGRPARRTWPLCATGWSRTSARRTSSGRCPRRPTRSSASTSRHRSVARSRWSPASPS